MTVPVSMTRYSVAGGASWSTRSLFTNVADFGATGDGATDDTAAVAEAVAEVAARADSHDTGGVVYFPFGRYRVTDTISVPKNIYLIGESAYASKLVLDAPGPISRFVEFGTTGAISTYCGVKSMQVDAGGLADVAVYLFGPQEGATVYEAWVLGARVHAVEAEATGVVGGSNKFVIDRSWCWTTGDAGMAGFRVESGTLSVRSSTFVGVDRTETAPAGSAGILATDATLVIDDVNCEYWQTGFSLTRSSAEFHGPSAFFVTNGLRCSVDNTDYPVFLTNAKWDCAGDDIVDLGAAVTFQSASSYMSAGRASVEPRHFRRQWVDHDTIRIMRPDTGQIYSLWVDSSGRLRIKAGDRASDTDGTIVGVQT